MSCRTVIDLPFLALYFLSNLRFLSTPLVSLNSFQKKFNIFAYCGLSHAWSFFGKWYIFSITCENCICDVAIPVLRMTVVDHGCTTRSDHIEDNNIGIESLQSTQHYVVRAKTNCLGIRILCHSGVWYISVNCCYNGLILYTFKLVHWSSSKRTSSSPDQCNLYSSLYCWQNTHLIWSNYHSFIKYSLPANR